MRVINDSELNYISGGITSTFIGGGVGCLGGTIIGAIAGLIAHSCFKADERKYMLAVSLSGLIGTLIGMSIGEILKGGKA